LSACLIATALTIRVLHARELAKGKVSEEAGDSHESNASLEGADFVGGGDVDGKPLVR
jgi:hypothetical protein